MNEVLRNVQAGRAGEGGELRDRINLAVDSEIAELVDHEGASYPLGRVVRGESGELFAEYGEVEYYLDHMSFLRRQGLIRFVGADLEDAEATELGRRVDRQLEDRRLGRRETGVRPFRRTSFDGVFVVGRPSAAQMTELVVASQIKNTFLGTEMANWQRFEMAESARYVIQVSAANGDPLTRLYGPDEFALVVENDDDADSLNSEIQVWLEEGEYYLAVYNLSEDKVEFSILVTIVGDV